MGKKVQTIKVVQHDETCERWYNGLVGQKVNVIDRNATVYEVAEGRNRGCLINKSKCQAA